jgi:hypothetical protein
MGCSAGDCGTPLTDTLFFIVDGQNIWQKAPITRGAWHDFVLHIKWSANSSVGFVELWYDGVKVVPKRFVRTLYNSGDTNYLKMGLYRDAITNPIQVLFHDGVIQATTYEEAAATAWAPSPPPPPPPPPDAGSSPPDAGSGPPPTPDGGTSWCPSPDGGGLLGSDRPADDAQVGCNMGATSAVSIPALLLAMGLLVRRRSVRSRAGPDWRARGRTAR